MSTETLIEFKEKITAVSNTIDDYRLLLQQTSGITPVSSVKVNRNTGLVIYKLLIMIYVNVKENRKLGRKKQSLQKKYTYIQNRQKSRGLKLFKRATGYLSFFWNRRIGFFRRLIKRR